MGLKEYNGVGAILADVDNDDGTFHGSRLESCKWYGL
jgi:hypothetical protein